MFRPRRLVAAATILFVAVAGVRAVLAYGPASIGDTADWPVSTGLLLPSLLLGCLVAARAPASPIGPALALTALMPALVFTVEDWGSTYGTDAPWPGARVVGVISGGVWAWLFLGFVALVLLFPDGPLPGRRWRLIWAAVPVSAALVNFAVATDLANFADGRFGDPPFRLPDPLRRGLNFGAFALFFVVLLTAASSLVVRYRRGDRPTRLRLGWLTVAALSVPILLATSWLGIVLGAPADVMYGGFLITMFILVPGAITVAILRHDLFDVDRLLGTTLSWLVTTLISAAVFAAVVFAVGNFFPDRVGITTAAFVTALALLPLHHWIHRTVARLVDPDRTVALARIRDFVRRVRDGQAEPEQIESVLRDALDDPGLRVLLRRPGEQLDVPDGAIPLRTGDSLVGALTLGTTSARRLRRAREAVVEARLPIEVSRLRVELREALAEVRASRARLMEDVAAERQRLERDLHDGAQQRLIAIGMRLRSVQYQLSPGVPAYRELDEVVETLEHTVAELRRIAHGVRPSRLDDGLAVALRDLVADSTLPVDLVVPELEVAESAATTVYFTVGEAIANALKHARATRISISVGVTDQVLRAVVRDDGVGGAREGFGLRSMRDRVASAGGEFTVDSPPGAGTSITVEIPCAS
ncbi:signal transduction histidine kinase [Kribbella sp. VKM Ac-2569]|uniref:sensor histidine kinase n=1 Tax=Kribbella sp. VKM Ac-2569 TaxID=2512220 RepID=UPI00102B2DA8|nr:sensor histidine kinase [Kribbella sp. VKM Ac-2569]RZT20951.1 signal transduction histidine kinase [Kribbella sp. VKM Ac-2569]